MPDLSRLPVTQKTRVDLHCHSRASTEADEAVLFALNCPESYSEPVQVYEQAKSRGMDLVTITDHDSIAGVSEILDLPDMLIGEELTCYFPEDRCKMHVLVWGITPQDHEALQNVADDIYAVAQYIADRRIAHAVAHPLYRQNGKLDRWHMERLLLLFKGFECLNGAHSVLHRDALDRLVDELDERGLVHLERMHEVTALWPESWIKARTGGSDDHGLFNIGRTWTEFPPDARTPEQVLECLRTGHCQPGGEAGSSIKLAHNFYGVGARYYARQVATNKSTAASLFMPRLVGEKPCGGKIAAAKAVARHLGSKALGKIGLGGPRRGVQLLEDLLTSAAPRRLRAHSLILSALRNGQAPLAEHESMFSLMSAFFRDVAGGVSKTIGSAIEKGEIGALFDLLSTVAAHQALLLPYYFALFQQNQERHLLARLCGHEGKDPKDLRIGVFTDTASDAQPAGRFARELSEWAQCHGRRIVVTSCDSAGSSSNWRIFDPLITQHLASADLDLAIPPVLEVLKWADEQQFDLVICNTPGPMGLCGWLVARMLRVPTLSLCHDDLPAQVLALSGRDYRLTAAARTYASWVFGASAATVALSRTGRDALHALQVDAERVTVLPPLAPTSPPQPRDHAARSECWERAKVREPRRLVCPVNRCSVDDAKLIAAMFERVSKQREDVALILIGGEPWLKIFRPALPANLPAYFVPSSASFADDLLASADLLLLPGRDLSGQTVIDSQAHGVPVMVGDAGAAQEFMDDGITGMVLPSGDAAGWANAALELLNDEPRRQRMARSGPPRVARFDSTRTMQLLWDLIVRTTLGEAGEPPAVKISPSIIAPTATTVQEVRA